MTLYLVLLNAGVEEVLTSPISVTSSDFSGAFASKNISDTVPANRGNQRIYLKYTYTKTGQTYGPLLSTTYYFTRYDTPPTPTGSVRIIPEHRFNSGQFVESNSNIELPPGFVMTCRYHSGDENGITIYQYATLKAVDAQGNPVDGIISVEYVGWSEWMTESWSDYYVPAGHVMTGRQHYGDEHGDTRYRYSVVKFNGKPCMVPREQPHAEAIYHEDESNTGSWNFPANKVLIGREHKGDETGKTWYVYSTISVNP